MKITPRHFAGALLMDAQAIPSYGYCQMLRAGVDGRCVVAIQGVGYVCWCEQVMPHGVAAAWLY